jgi:hypothetical protein
MPVKTLVLIFLIFLACCPQAVAGDISAVPSSVRTYEKALADFESGKGRFESAFSSGLVAAQDLERILEKLSDSEISIAQKAMRGFYLNREEFVAVVPEPEFFKALVRKSKIGADRDFIDMYFRTKPDGLWDIYIEQQTDITGCTQFNGTLTQAYKDWAAFRKKHPDAYAAHVTSALNGVVAALINAGCICGDKAGFKKELQEFPLDELSTEEKDKIRARLAPNADRQLHFSCMSG